MATTLEEFDTYFNNALTTRMNEPSVPLRPQTVLAAIAREALSILRAMWSAGMRPTWAGRSGHLGYPDDRFTQAASKILFSRNADDTAYIFTTRAAVIDLYDRRDAGHRFHIPEGEPMAIRFLEHNLTRRGVGGHRQRPPPQRIQGRTSWEIIAELENLTPVTYEEYQHSTLLAHILGIQVRFGARPSVNVWKRELGLTEMEHPFGTADSPLLPYTEKWTELQVLLYGMCVTRNLTPRNLHTDIQRLVEHVVINSISIGRDAVAAYMVANQQPLKAFGTISDSEVFRANMQMRSSRQQNEDPTDLVQQIISNPLLTPGEVHQLRPERPPIPQAPRTLPRTSNPLRNEWGEFVEPPPSAFRTTEEEAEVGQAGHPTPQTVRSYFKVPQSVLWTWGTNAAGRRAMVRAYNDSMELSYAVIGYHADVAERSNLELTTEQRIRIHRVAELLYDQTPVPPQLLGQLTADLIPFENAAVELRRREMAQRSDNNRRTMDSLRREGRTPTGRIQRDDVEMQNIPRSPRRRSQEEVQRAGVEAAKAKVEGEAPPSLEWGRKLDLD